MDLSSGNKKLTSEISEHHYWLKNQITFSFRCQNSTLNVSLFTMPHPLTISVWLVTQTLILLLGQFMQPWSQQPSLPYVCCWKPICLGTHPAPVGQHTPPYRPEKSKSSSIFLPLFCLWDLTHVLSPSYIICHQNHVQVIFPATKNYNPILKYWLSTVFYLVHIYIEFALCQA